MNFSEEVLDSAIFAGRGEYRRLYQNTHDPRVVRMVDDAVEAALTAAGEIIVAQALRDAAENIPEVWVEDVNPLPPPFGGSYDDSEEARNYIRELADSIWKEEIK